MEGYPGLSEAGRDALGYIGGGILALSLIPQIVKLMMTRSAADISLMWSILYFIGTTLSFVYLFILGALAAWIPVAVEVVGCAITISLKLLYDHTDWGINQQKNLQQQQMLLWQEQYAASMKLAALREEDEHEAATDPADVKLVLSGQLQSTLSTDSNGAAVDGTVNNGPSNNVVYEPKQQTGDSTKGGSADGSSADGGSKPTSGCGASSRASSGNGAPHVLYQLGSAQPQHLPWYFHTGISHTTAMPPPVHCCHACGAQQLQLRPHSSSQAGGSTWSNLLSSLTGSRASGVSVLGMSLGGASAGSFNIHYPHHHYHSHAAAAGSHTHMAASPASLGRLLPASGFVGMAPPPAAAPTSMSAAGAAAPPAPAVRPPRHLSSSLHPTA